MARTKKQTLVNACERRRQIQEDIRRDTLAAKQKRECFSSAVNINSAHKDVPITNQQTVSCLEKMDNGTGLSIVCLLKLITCFYSVLTPFPLPAYPCILLEYKLGTFIFVSACRAC